MVSAVTALLVAGPHVAGAARATVVQLVETRPTEIGSPKTGPTRTGPPKAGSSAQLPGSLPSDTPTYAAGSAVDRFAAHTPTALEESVALPPGGAYPDGGAAADPDAPTGRLVDHPGRAPPAQRAP